MATATCHETGSKAREGADVPPVGARCAAPFAQLTLQPSGRVSPCCYHYGLTLGDATREELLAIWNGARMKKLRREFLSGSVRTCKSRMHNLRCHETFERFSADVTWTEEQASPPRRLDVRLGGQCNLTCKMCEVWREPNHRYDETSFWQKGPREIFPFLEEIDVLGGEPWIQKDTYRLIAAVSAVNPTCRWSFVTNAHYRWTKRLEDTLGAIPLRMIQVSVDSLEKQTYEAIRRGGRFELMMKTLERYIAYRDQRRRSGSGFELKLSLCALVDNWREIPHFLSYCRDVEATPELQFAFYDPSGEASLARASAELKAEIVATLTAAVPAVDHRYLDPVITPLAARHEANRQP